jgi:glutaredoxin
MTEVRDAPSAEVFEIFWMPGCSSCLRMKEFVERMGIAHRAVDVNAAPEQARRLAALGLGVPAAVRGEVGVPGVDLVGIAHLAGIAYEPPNPLDPDELHQRYGAIATVTAGLIARLGADALEYKSPDRDRTMRQLALHASTIMRGFVGAEETNVFTDGYEFVSPELAGSATAEQILAVLAETRTVFEQWWEQVGYDDPFDRILESVWGTWTLHEALERAVWHTTQHTRQLEYFVLDALLLGPAPRLSHELLAGLPLPKGIHA